MTRVKIVAGGNFGDEGKGLLTDYFAERAGRQSGKCLVVLSNGGAQRGHTVVHEGKRHVFQHIGSGALQGADTFCPRQFIVNPMIFMKEYTRLTEQFPEMKDCSILVHPDCMITTPYEMIANLALEELRGEDRHGSVGAGIWETVIGKGKHFQEVLQMSRKEVLSYLAEDRRERLFRRIREAGFAGLPAAWREVAENGALAERFYTDLQRMAEHAVPADEKILRQYPELIFENGQGLLLDRGMKWKGYGDHTTPSHTGIRNPAEILRDAYQGTGEMLEIEAVYVSRTYMTRHGAGRFDTECEVKDINPVIRDLTNQPNESQGMLRYGRLNYRSLLRRVRRDFSGLSGYLQTAQCRFRADYSLAFTHLNEYPCPCPGSGRIRYTSSCEEGENRVRNAGAAAFA